MTTVQQAMADLELTLPEVITGYVDGAAIPVRDGASRHPVHFPGTGEQISSLQEDDPAAVGEAIECARSHFQGGAWSRASTATRQSIFRRAATLIRQHAEALGLLECLCAGLPSSHLASRQVPRAADNLDFFADYIGVMAGETFEQLPGYQTSVTRQPAGVAALFAPWNAPLALASMQIASCLAFGNTCVLKPSEFTPLSILKTGDADGRGRPATRHDQRCQRAAAPSPAQRWPAHLISIVSLSPAAAVPRDRL